MSEIHDNWSKDQVHKEPYEYIPKIVFVGVAEAGMFATHYLIYHEVLPFPDGTYLVDVPPFNMILDPDSELSLSHLISFLFALASVLAPIVLWRTVFAEQLPEAWHSFIGTISGRLKAIFIPLIYMVIIALEIAAFNTFLVQAISDSSSVFLPNDETDWINELLTQHGSVFSKLGTFVLIMINAIISYFAVATFFEMKERGELS